MATSIFDFVVPSIEGGEISLSNYGGKKCYLVVNVACECGLTVQNYDELVQLYDKYSGAGFEIIAVPCNNFGEQEPGPNSQIQEFVQEKGGKFPVIGKLECWNGEKTHPLYAFLTSSIPDADGTNNLKWNFAKFLCNAEGVPVKRFAPDDAPFGFEADIVSFL